VIRAGQQVRTPPAAYQPAGAPRRPMPRRVEVPDPLEALLIGGAGPAIGTLVRLGVAQRDRASTPEPASVEPGGPVRADDDLCPDADPAADPTVTSEELTILTLMANGLTLDSVAIRVSVSPRTLSRRLRCVCDRLGVTHPIQAIVWAAHQGLI